MCNKDGCCQKPKELKGKPEDCSPEQIRKCHGDVKGHPCVSQASKDFRNGRRDRDYFLLSRIDSSIGTRSGIDCVTVVQTISMSISK